MHFDMVFIQLQLQLLLYLCHHVLHEYWFEFVIIAGLLYPVQCGDVLNEVGKASRLRMGLIYKVFLL